MELLQKLDGLVDKAVFLLGDGDRVPYVLRGAYTFQQGDNEVGDIVLNVPQDGDFFGSRFNLFLESRQKSLSDPTLDELTYRPALWFHQKNTGVLSTLALRLVDGQLSMRTPQGEYQNNLPWPIAFTFSAAGMIAEAGGENPGILLTAYPGGCRFHVPFFIARGTAVQVRVTPTYSPALTDQDTYAREFRIVAVMTGEKRVHAFR